MKGEIMEDNEAISKLDFFNSKIYINAKKVILKGDPSTARQWTQDWYSNFDFDILQRTKHNTTWENIYGMEF